MDVRDGNGISIVASNAQLKFGDVTWALKFQMDNNGNLELKDHYNNPLIHYSQSGKVGIGVTSNLYDKLEIKGGIRLINDDASWRFVTNIGGSFSIKQYGFSGAFNIYKSETGNKNLLNLKDGKVGIGTIETGTHKLAVEGSIGARKVKVEATGWSDFVFEEDYALPTLSEVESYIQANNHLQDIPSAKEVEENGIDLGEMDAKLLQKIEELMLYTIEQEKKIKKLEKEIIKLNKQ
ncbi:hypothetical protein R9C00_04750 [Flammeovirgaceae bacterium SG7u.111]|nr:hypothetical protein [Flammeovirgaceae bacterium SG7u.132]WPO36752.1 hypothetical protein R9C00_04750 [Flammeovirgaceae bacterium SG7u.111]